MIKNILKDRPFLAVLAYVTLLIVVDNLLLQSLQSPVELINWLAKVYGDPKTYSIPPVQSAISPLLPSWLDSLIWVAITVLVYIFRKKFLLVPLIIYNAWLTFWLIASVGMLSANLWNPGSVADILLSDGLFVWTANLIIFTIWYWILDHNNQLKFKANPQSPVHFLFSPTIEKSPGWKSWTPGFIDYFFLSFNTSTAWGSSDTVIISKRAKIFIMMESFVSLVLFVVIIARAINLI